MVKISLYVYIVDVEPPSAIYFYRFGTPLLKILTTPLSLGVENPKMARRNSGKFVDGDVEFPNVGTLKSNFIISWCGSKFCRTLLLELHLSLNE